MRRNYPHPKGGIAIYHCTIKIIKCSEGRSAVAAAAYRSGQKLTNEWDGQNPAMKYARRYVEHWTAMKERRQGLLLWGGVGTGKTFAAYGKTERPRNHSEHRFCRKAERLSGVY